MFSWEGEDQVDLIVGYELVGRFDKIEEADEIEFGFVCLQGGFQLGPFRFVFVGDLDIVFMVYVDDIEVRAEEIEDGFHAIDGDRIVDVFEVGEQHYIFD